MNQTNKPWELEGLTESEYEMIVDLLGREPNYTELGMFGVMWSEHCSYKNSKAVLRNFPTEGEVVLQGPGENAGIIDIGDNQAVSFKIESHNHPSAIEPYQGAATGVGGIIRDIFTMGARPIALLDSLRFGLLDDEHVKYLFKEVVAGIAGYGNSIGVPTVGGETFFSNSYQGNPLVNAMCVGIMDHKDISTATASGIGNPVMVVGAATGRDGIQGASFASDELTDESEEDRPTVQVGDPFMEKLLLEASLELIKTGCLVGIQDMGAAGLISSASEMASRGETGIELDIDLVPKREEGMTPYEVLLSESQERMLVVPEAGKEELVQKIFAKWDLNAAVIGEVTDDGKIRVLNKGEKVAEVPARILADDAPEYKRESREPDYYNRLKSFEIESLFSKKKNTTIALEDIDYNSIFEEIITSENMASKAYIYEQYDHMVQTNTVVLPGSDAAILRIKGKDKGLALTTDCNSRYSYLDPERGGEIAVAEAARNITCSGGRPLAITDGLNFGNPMKPEIFWQFEKSITGISKACQALNTPVTGGNVSFYNESPEGAVYPTPIVGMVGLLDKLEYATDQFFKDEGDLIILLGSTEAELGGSQYLESIQGLVKGKIPELDLEKEKKVQKTCLELIKAGLVKSAHDCSDGGLAVTLFESSIGNLKGAEIKIETDLRAEELLFSETQSRIVISLVREDKDQAEEIIGENIEYRVIGEVKAGSLKINNLLDINIEEMKSKWQEAIPSKLIK
ncbi:MAG: phosphoribosylformylglycinamidine synthase subunit PurL [Bacillota bacterium]